MKTDYSSFTGGFDQNGSWRLFALRKDFVPAGKLLAEDDITVSTVAPLHLLNEIGPGTFKESAKFVHNCEYRLFQRPDDAIHRGFDKQTEKDLSRPGNFISNFQCLDEKDAKEQISKTLTFDQYTDPMRDLILSASGKRGKPANSFLLQIRVSWMGNPLKTQGIYKQDPICSIKISISSIGRYPIAKKIKS